MTETGNTFVFQREIRADELEPFYLHIHHASILRMLEEARAAFLAARGHPLEAYISRELFFVLTKVEVKFLREVRGGHWQITCERCGAEGRRMWIGQRMLDERGKCAVEAVIEFALLDGKRKRAIPPPEELIQALVAG